MENTLKWVWAAPARPFNAYAVPPLPQTWPQARWIGWTHMRNLAVAYAPIQSSTVSEKDHTTESYQERNKHHLNISMNNVATSQSSLVFSLGKYANRMSLWGQHNKTERKRSDKSLQHIQNCAHSNQPIFSCVFIKNCWTNLNCWYPNTDLHTSNIA